MSDNSPASNFVPRLTIIEAGRAERQYWRDLWSYRELLYFLAWRDILVRYKQTLLGVAWAIIRPLLTVIIFATVFGKLAGLSSGVVPYSVMVFVAMLPWQLFANNLLESGSSIVNNGSMVSKVYFPRLIIPVSTILVNLIDFFISAILLLALMLYYGIAPGWRSLSLPLFIGLAIITSLGFGLWTAALNVKYRDFKFIATFGVQLGLYLSPVGFSSDVVPDKWRLLYSLNPMVGVIDGFRWALLGQDVKFYLPGFLFSACFAVVLLASGITYFRKTEKSFADDI